LESHFSFCGNFASHSFFLVYTAHIASCYSAANILAQISSEYVKGLRKSCKLESPLASQFSYFLMLFIPGIILFPTYWLSMRPRIMTNRAGQLSTFLLLLMFDSLQVMVYAC